MRIGNYTWDIDPDQMTKEELETLIAGLECHLEDKVLEDIDKKFEQAFDYAHKEGYKVFYDGTELSPYDLYIATLAP